MGSNDGVDGMTGAITRRRGSRVRVWLSAAAVLVALLLVPLMMMQPLYAAFAVVGLAIAVTALILNVGAGKGTASSSAQMWALLALIVSGLMSIALIVTIIVGVSLSRPHSDRIVLRVQGGDEMTVTFTDSVRAHTETWQSTGEWAYPARDTKTAEITATVPADEIHPPLKCQILINDKEVVSEQSDGDSVTCTYNLK